MDRNLFLGNLLQISFVGLFLGIIHPQLQAQSQTKRLDIFAIESEFSDLNTFLYVLEDDLPLSASPSILSGQYVAKFQPWSQHPPLKAQRGYWLRLDIYNHLDLSSHWILNLGHLNRAYIFCPEKENEYLLQTDGELIAYHDKAIGGNRKETLARVSLEPRQLHRIYIYLRNEMHYAPDVKAELIYENHWHHLAKQDNFWQGIFQGILWIMIVYNLVLFWLIRDRAYLYYTLYVSCVVVFFLWFHGDMLEFFFPTRPYLNYHFRLIYGLAPIFYILFLKNLLDVGRLLPFWYWILKLYVKISIFIYLAACVIYTFYLPQLAALLMNILLISATMLALVVLYRLLKKQVRVVIFILVGNIFLIFTAIGGVILNYWFPVSNYHYFLEAGIVAEILLFSVGLGYKIKVSEMEKRVAQAKLIKQLEAYEKVQSEANRELERKVADRTAEIQNQKEALEEQKQEITLQRDAIEQKNQQLMENEKKINHSLEELKATQEELLCKQKDLESINQKLENNETVIKKAYEKLKENQGKIEKKNQQIAEINATLEQKIKQRTQQLEQANRELDLFIYRSSHDLRRPLTSIMGIVELAKISLEDTVAQDLFARIHEVAVSMDKILTKLRMVCDINDKKLIREEIRLGWMIKNIQKHLGKKIKQRNIKLDTLIQKDIRISSNDTLINSVIYNLLENAIYFSKGPEPCIHIRAFLDKTWLCLQVEDNGEGIPAELKDQVFDMYFRASERSQGNGLGLYVVKRAVDRLGGQIKLESELGDYTKIEVRLPLNEPNEL